MGDKTNPEGDQPDGGQDSDEDEEMETPNQHRLKTLATEATTQRALRDGMEAQWAREGADERTRRRMSFSLQRDRYQSGLHRPNGKPVSSKPSTPNKGGGRVLKKKTPGEGKGNNHYMIISTEYLICLLQ